MTWVAQRANFANANAARTRQAAPAVAAKAAWALAVLAGQASSKMIAAARLRIEHPTMSLTELAALADPPTTKDAVSGALRRLVESADRAAGRGVRRCGRRGRT